VENRLGFKAGRSGQSAAGVGSLSATIDTISIDLRNIKSPLTDFNGKLRWGHVEPPPLALHEMRRLVNAVLR